MPATASVMVGAPLVAVDTIQARQTTQDGPSGDVVVVDHQTAKLLISGGVEIVSTYQLTLTKGQGHYPRSRVCLSV